MCQRKIQPYKYQSIDYYSKDFLAKQNYTYIQSKNNKRRIFPLLASKV